MSKTPNQPDQAVIGEEELPKTLEEYAVREIYKLKEMIAAKDIKILMLDKDLQDYSNTVNNIKSLFKIDRCSSTTDDLKLVFKFPNKKSWVGDETLLFATVNDDGTVEADSANLDSFVRIVNMLGLKDECDELIQQVLADRAKAKAQAEIDAVAEENKPQVDDEDLFDEDK